ncbi:Cryptic beta-glucoside bgl operon antiterminator [Corynebacterium atrinae]|uniref:PRD domain-containing protein n=1 Tax=Corynebacterium atrinae TaxID=1336740 RepID=UPI0025B52430|nr:PRD domain-containing protein [Corynebacterium atrinae]WJY64331.1 Cryptic beta-glucoside bgl operon antiterminator [Corynebacterium atrinae]
MVESHPRVVRVLSNNAVLARVGDDDSDDGGLVLVGRGIGFGRQVGDPVSATVDQRQYIELSPDKVQLLTSLNALDPYVIETISTAVDLAADLLGELHPSVYLVLAEHLSYAVDRVGKGEVIRNSLLEEIKAVFGAEFGAAELIVQYLNSHLTVDLPIDEAAFIALHLNAARSGVTVKQPLAKANELAGLATFIRHRLPRAASTSDDGLITTLTYVLRRARAGQWRDNHAQRSIVRDLPREYDLAEQVLCRILDTSTLPRDAAGEAAYLAVFLHGWVQTPQLKTHTRKEQS